MMDECQTMGPSLSGSKRKRSVLAMQSSIGFLACGGDLIAEVRGCAQSCGVHNGNWPGLRTYRYSSRMNVACKRMTGPGLFAVVQGEAQILLAGELMRCPQFCYLVLPAESTAVVQAYVASPTTPFLGLYLPLDPELIQSLSKNMVDSVPCENAQGADDGNSIGFQLSVLRSLHRFLRATLHYPDRRVLAPVYMHEIVYLLLREGQVQRLSTGATKQTNGNIIPEVRNFVRQRMSEPLSVADLAKHVAMSESAFAHKFRRLAGIPPYQYVKALRLDRARELLITEERGVGEIARDVGYSSVSHFSKDFRRHHGVPPRTYTDTLQQVVSTDPCERIPLGVSDPQRDQRHL
jgi:AraC-like DNA-binding protein